MVALLLPSMTIGLSLIAEGCLIGAPPRGQPRTPVLCTCRRPFMGRPVPRQFMRNGWLDLATIVPATACHRRSYAERYSRFMGLIPITPHPRKPRRRMLRLFHNSFMPLWYPHQTTMWSITVILCWQPRCSPTGVDTRRAPHGTHAARHADAGRSPSALLGPLGGRYPQAPGARHARARAAAAGPQGPTGTRNCVTSGAWTGRSARGVCGGTHS